jgi:hypothetical protein
MTANRFAPITEMDFKLTYQDQINLVSTFLKEHKFEKTLDLFRQETGQYSDTIQMLPPQSLSSVLKEYCEMKTEKVRKEEFIKSCGPTNPQQSYLVNGIVNNVYNLLEVFNQSVKTPLMPNLSENSLSPGLGFFEPEKPKFTPLKQKAMDPKSNAPPSISPRSPKEKSKRKRSSNIPVHTTINKIAPKSQHQAPLSYNAGNQYVQPKVNPIKTIFDENSQSSLHADFLNEVGTLEYTPEMGRLLLGSGDILPEAKRVKTDSVVNSSPRKSPNKLPTTFPQTEPVRTIIPFIHF